MSREASKNRRFHQPAADSEGFGVRLCCGAVRGWLFSVSAAAATHSKTLVRTNLLTDGSRMSALIVLPLALCLAGCTQPLPENALLVAQTPHKSGSTPARDVLDIRYPGGSRVAILSGVPLTATRVLSAGFFAAGEPIVSYDGHRIVFAGKSSPNAEWQIYGAELSGGQPVALTSIKGGAMDPALLGDGTLLFVSPVPAVGKAGTPDVTTALYAQTPGRGPHQITFGQSVSDPTVLSDGRILFVSVGSKKSISGSALYTINNDGTELTAFAAQHDARGWLRRPRELSDERIAFLTSENSTGLVTTAEVVLSARPFRSRARLVPNSTAQIRSVQPTLSGDWLVCAQLENNGDGSPAFCEVFQVKPSAPVLNRPVFEDPSFDTVEAAALMPGPRPMGRLSNVDPSHNTGQILCLDVNDTTIESGNDLHRAQAKRIRIFTKSSTSHELLLGEVDVQSDGSFIAEVPADIPLGFEAVDEQGTVLRREPPLMWVRPGENRSCIGCHEPHNHSPRNVRPLAVRVAVPHLRVDYGKLAKKEP